MNLKKIRKFHPKQYQKNNQQMLSLIENFIEKDDSHPVSGISHYFMFGFFFLILQCLFSFLHFFENLPNLELCFIYWLFSYIIVLLFYSIFQKRWPIFSKRFLTFNFICLFIHTLIFLLLHSLIVFSHSIILSSFISLILNYPIFMLVFGGREFFSD